MADVEDDAAMEPGREGREDPTTHLRPGQTYTEPQWSPAVKGGKTTGEFVSQTVRDAPQWSPAVKAGKTW